MNAKIFGAFRTEPSEHDATLARASGLCANRIFAYQSADVDFCAHESCTLPDDIWDASTSTGSFLPVYGCILILCVEEKDFFSTMIAPYLLMSVATRTGEIFSCFSNISILRSIWFGLTMSRVLNLALLELMSIKKIAWIPVRAYRVAKTRWQGLNSAVQATT